MIWRFVFLLIPVFAFGQTATENTFTGRLENEYKLSVPEGEESLLWRFLADELSFNDLSDLKYVLKSTVEIELFTDLYFDSDDGVLYEHEAGVRYRERYVRDSLSKSLVQLKLPLEDEEGIIRQEIKFNAYENRKRNDRKAEHPFWQYVHPRDRDDVNLHLAAFGIRGDVLAPSLKLTQTRKRVYLSDNVSPVMTITLDNVKYGYFPYIGFTEMELELNEIRYTNADDDEKQKLEALNTEIKKRILKRFPKLKQDQTPKYNKMKTLVKRNFMARAYDNLMYVLLVILVLFTAVLVLRRNNLLRKSL